ncbi:MAG: UMP kinase, partial [Pseudomonadota bacterium]
MKRYVVKLSCEALQGDKPSGHDPDILKRIAQEISDAASEGAQLAIVVGGGNIIRGARLAAEGGDRVAGDHMGMLGTLINGVAIREALREVGARCTLLSGLPAPTICETYSQRAMLDALDSGN